VSIERARELLEKLGAGEASWHDKHELCRILHPILDDAAAWRHESNVLGQMQAKVIPCGHSMVDLIGGEGLVTKCGACLAARSKTIELVPQ
jgi:hypothetical protein